MSRRALVVVVAAVLAFVVVLAWYKYWRVSAMMAEAAAFPEPAEAIQVATARQITWQPVAAAAGTIVAKRFVTLSNELAGTIAVVRFESGQIVAERAVLLTLDTRTERAELRSAESDIRLARLTVERKGRLVEQRAGSQSELDRARAELAQAEARRDVIAATVARKTLRAPFRGRIGLRDVHPGQYLAEGTALTTLEGLDSSVFVDFRLPQEVAVQIAAGAPVRLTGAALGKVVTAVVTAVDARADEASRNVRVRAETDQLGDAGKPGAFVDVSVAAAAARAVLAVPLAAVRRAAYGDHVYLIAAAKPRDKGPRAEQRFVKAGPVIGTDIVILEGLRVGDRVATDGAFKLRQGALVSVTAPVAAPVTAPITAPVAAPIAARQDSPP